MPYNSIEQTRMHTRKHEPEGTTKDDDIYRKNAHDNIITTYRSTSQPFIETTNSALIMSYALSKQHYQHNPIIIKTLTPNTATDRAIMTMTPSVTSAPTRSLSRLLSASARYQLKSANIRSKRVILNPSAISLVLLCHLISNQLFTQTIMTTTTTTSATSRPLDGLDSSNNNLNNQYNQINQSGSLFQLVAANPAPIASPSSARSATSVSHRVPPINGSMFGKRSLDNLAKTRAPPATKRQAPADLDNYTPTSQTDNYNDIITDIIESFLAKNSANSPDEAAVAFCRMIVYECNQMLKARTNNNNNNNINRRGANQLRPQLQSLT